MPDAKHMSVACSFNGWRLSKVGVLGLHRAARLVNKSATEPCNAFDVPLEDAFAGVSDHFRQVDSTSQVLYVGCSTWNLLVTFPLMLQGHFQLTSRGYLSVPRVAVMEHLLRWVLPTYPACTSSLEYLWMKPSFSITKIGFDPISIALRILCISVVVEYDVYIFWTPGACQYSRSFGTRRYQACRSVDARESLFSTLFWDYGRCQRLRWSQCSNKPKWQICLGECPPTHEFKTSTFPRKFRTWQMARTRQILTRYQLVPASVACHCYIENTNKGTRNVTGLTNETDFLLPYWLNYLGGEENINKSQCLCAGANNWIPTQVSPATPKWTNFSLWGWGVSKCIERRLLLRILRFLTKHVWCPHSSEEIQEPSADKNLG